MGLFCNIITDHVFESPDVRSIYEIPLVLHNQNFDYAIMNRLGLSAIKGHSNIKYLEDFIRTFENPETEVTIAICGKYNSLHDAYKSIIEAFIHAGVANSTEVKIKWIDTEELEKTDQSDSFFENIDGVLIPGGFGDRGIEGKVLSSKYARENKIPFLGICLGMQCAIIDFARNVCKMKMQIALNLK